MPNQPSDYRSFVRALEEEQPLFLQTEWIGHKQTMQMTEISILTYTGVLCIDRFVQPTREPWTVEHIWTIPNEDLIMKAEKWSEFHEVVKTILENRVVVCWNPTFQRYVLHRSDEENEPPNFDYCASTKWFDLALAFKHRYLAEGASLEEQDDIDLDFAMRFYACDLRDLSRSGNVCDAVQDVFKCMMAEYLFNGAMDGVPFVGDMGVD